MLYVDCKATDVYEQIKVLKEIGVRHTFINAKHPELDRVLDAIKKAGIICDTLHAEYSCSDGERFQMDDVSKEGTAGEKMIARIMHNIDKCAEHHIPVIVIHPSNQPPETVLLDAAPIDLIFFTYCEAVSLPDLY